VHIVFINFKSAHGYCYVVLRVNCPVCVCVAVDIFFRIDAFKGCGDLIFSSHTLLAMTTALSFNKYSTSKYLKVRYMPCRV